MSVKPCAFAATRASSSISGPAEFASARIATTTTRKSTAWWELYWNSGRRHMPDSFRQRIAVYTGVFDPIHLGHLDVIQRGSRIFDRLVVGVGINPEKTAFFTLEERVKLVQQIVKAHGNVEV